MSTIIHDVHQDWFKKELDDMRPAFLNQAEYDTLLVRVGTSMSFFSSFLIKIVCSFNDQHSKTLLHPTSFHPRNLTSALYQVINSLSGQRLSWRHSGLNPLLGYASAMMQNFGFWEGNQKYKW